MDLQVFPESVRRGDTFNVRVSVRNDGNQVSGSLEVTVSAIVQHARGTTVLPVGAGGRMNLLPGETAAFSFSRPEGVHIVGVYRLVASVSTRQPEDGNTGNNQLEQRLIVS